MEFEEYVTGYTQTLSVHSKADCIGPFCVIHNPSNHHMREWRTYWIEGHMRRVCFHSVSHPDPDDLAYPTIDHKCECKCCVILDMEMKCELIGIFPLL